MWDADTVAYREDKTFYRAYQGDELIWEKGCILYYTSSNGNIVNVSDASAFLDVDGNVVPILSNTYNGEQGIIIFNSQIKTIGTGAFKSAHTLTSVVIPDTVLELGEQSFFQCTGLTSVNLNNVTTAGKDAFRDCFHLTDIQLNNCNHFGNTVFAGCMSLQHITLPDNVSSISYGLFYQCYSLEDIVIPDSVQTIDVSAFRFCSGLTSVSIGSGVKSIGNLAFGDCTKLKNIYVPNSNPPEITYTTFKNIATGGTLTITSESADYWNYYEYWFGYEPNYLGYYMWNGAARIGDIVYSLNDIKSGETYVICDGDWVTLNEGHNEGIYSVMQTYSLNNKNRILYLTGGDNHKLYYQGKQLGRTPVKLPQYGIDANLTTNNEAIYDIAIENGTGKLYMMYEGVKIYLTYCGNNVKFDNDWAQYPKLHNVINHL